MKKRYYRFIRWVLVTSLLPGFAAVGEAEEWPQACRRFIAGDRQADLAEALEATSLRFPEQPCGHLFRGLLQRGAGLLEVAAESLEHGLERHPRHLPLLLELAVTLSWNGQIEAALVRYRQAISLEPDSMAARLGEARMLSWLGELDEAGALYKELETQNPGNGDALKGLAFVLRAQMRLQAATAIYRSVLENSPNDGEALEGLEAIAEVQRWQVKIHGGTENTAGPSDRQSFGLSVRYQRRPRSFLTLSLAREGVIFRDPLLGGGSIDRPLDTWRGSFSVGVGPRMTAGVSLEVRHENLADGRKTAQFFGTELSREAGRATVLAGLRYGDDDRTGTSFLGFVGGFFAPGENQEVAIQLFGSEDPLGEIGVALAGRWQATFRDRLSCQLGITVGEDPGTSFLQTSARLSYRLSRRLEVGADYRFYEGRLQQTSLAGEVILRF